MIKIKRFIPSLILITLVMIFIYLFIKNKGIDSLVDDWVMTIVGFITALAIGLFFFRKAIIK